MTAKKQIVRVTVVGEEYAIRSDAQAEHTEAVAEYVEQTIRRIASNAPVVDSHKAAVMAALQIADELFRMRQDADELTRALGSLSDDVRRWLPPSKRGVPPVGGEAGGRAAE